MSNLLTIRKKVGWSRVGSTRKGQIFLIVLVSLVLVMSMFTIAVKSVRYTTAAKRQVTMYYQLRVMEQLFLDRYFTELKQAPVMTAYQQIDYNIGFIRYKVQSEKLLYEVYNEKNMLIRRYQVFFQ